MRTARTTIVNIISELNKIPTRSSMRTPRNNAIDADAVVARYIASELPLSRNLALVIL